MLLNVPVYCSVYVLFSQYTVYCTRLQDSEDYRALRRQFELQAQQLESAQRESWTSRESAEKARKEAQLVRSQLESGTGTLRFELESARGELADLKQIIQALSVELENSKKQNAEVFVRCTVCTLFSLTIRVQLQE